MPNLANKTRCFFCRRELNSGEGRYRFFHKEKEVECCPPCFDEMRAFPRLPLGEAAVVRPSRQPENNFGDRSGE